MSANKANTRDSRISQGQIDLFLPLINARLRNLEKGSRGAIPFNREMFQAFLGSKEAQEAFWETFEADMYRKAIWALKAKVFWLPEAGVGVSVTPVPHDPRHRTPDRINLGDADQVQNRSLVPRFLSGDDGQPRVWVVGKTLMDELVETHPGLIETVSLVGAGGMGYDPITHKTGLLGGINPVTASLYKVAVERTDNWSEQAGLILTDQRMRSPLVQEHPANLLINVAHWWLVYVSDVKLDRHPGCERYRG